MLTATIVDNGIHGLRQNFVDSSLVRYRFESITPDWRPVFDDDFVIVPNGSDHVALHRARPRIEAVLQRGGAVLCFCGCFMPWLPGTRWIHDNTRDLRGLRYTVVDDRFGLMEGVDPMRLSTEEHGISGWWTCGALITRHAESVVLADTWGRAALIADSHSTPGLVVATASGPLGDADPDAPDAGGAQRLYRNILSAVVHHIESRHG